MKKLIALLTLCCLTVSAQTYYAIPADAINAPPPTASATLAPTNPPSVADGFKMIKDAVTAPPYHVAVYGLYAPGLQNKYGGGIGFFKPLSTNTLSVLVGTRIDYVDGGFWMPSGNATLQATLHPFKNIAWLPNWARRIEPTPFAYVGVGVPLSGAKIASVTVPGVIRDNNGQATAILGQGLVLTVYSPTNKNWSLSIVGDRETWSGFAGTQYRGGLLYNRKF